MKTIFKGLFRVIQDGGQAEVTRDRKLLRVNKLAKQYGMLFILVGLIILGWLLSDHFLTFSNLLNIARQVVVIGLMAVGETFVILAGGIDLSLGGVLSASAIFAATAQTLPFPIIVLLTVIFASVFGFITGNLISRAGITAFIASMGMGTVAEGVAFLLSGGQPIFIQHNAGIFSALGNGSFLGIPIPVIVLVFCIIIGQLFLSKTTFGVYFKALGGNEEATFWSGINIKKYRTLSFILAGAFTGAAAIIAVARTSVGDPMIGQNLTLDAISAVIIGGTYFGGGGTGSVGGTLIGALIMGIINNLFNLLDVNAYWQMVAKGAIVIGAVYIGARRK
jgi:inositol transport system permease protein